MPTKSLSAERSFLQAFIRAYLHQASRMSYRQLTQRQIAPRVGLYHGAAGLAYTFWYAGITQESEARLRQAKRWANLAARHQHNRYAFHGATRLLHVGRLSVPYGRPGVSFVGALVSSARGEDHRASIDRFLSLYRPHPKNPAEFLQGAAGYLCALSVLYKHAPDSRLSSLGDQIAAALLEEPSPFVRLNILGFAHGEAGIRYSLLRWSLASGYPLPEAFFGGLRSFAKTPPASFSSAMPTSWCNGSAGLGLLLVRAYEHTKDEFFLQQAEAAGHFTAEGSDTSHDLCCGLGGRAYALLALERMAPKRGWYQKAMTLALEAIQSSSSEWPNGLFRGYPGLVCLAIALLQKEPEGFPL